MENKDIEAMIEQSMLDETLMEHGGANTNNASDFDPTLSSFNDSGVGGGISSNTHSYNNSTDFSRRHHNNRNNTSDWTVGSTSFNHDQSSSASSSPKDILYCSNYFDLDDILSQTIRISVKFQRTVPKLGFLDPSFSQLVVEDQTQQQQQQQNDISKGTKLELPLWIVKELNGDQVITITMPKSYNVISREILEADANCVDLHKLGPNFYLTGKHLTAMNLAESEDIALSLLDTYTQRFHRLVNFALSVGDGSNSTQINTDDNCAESQSSISQIDKIIKNNVQNRFSKESKGATSVNDVSKNDLIQFIAHLDNWERNLMGVGRRISQQIKRWQNREIVKVNPNEMVVNLRKRRILLEQQHKLQSQITNNN